MSTLEKLKAMPEREALFVAVARCRLNFYPGTLTPTPEDYRREVVSDPMPREAARAKVAEWESVVEAPGWEFSVEPVAALAAATE